MKTNKLSVRQLSTVTLLSLMVLVPIVAQATPFVTAPPSGQMTANWWQWAVASPNATSPITSNSTTDPSGQLCNTGQNGSIWFLAGTTGGNASRNCTIPFGKFIMFPIINAECSTNEGNGNGYKQLKACANFIIDQVNATNGVEADIDGTNVKNLSNYRVQSPLYNFDPVEFNVFNIPPGAGQSVSDGYWVLLSPLSIGQHKIHFYGAAPTFGFDTGVNYSITIK